MDGYRRFDASSCCQLRLHISGDILFLYFSLLLLAEHTLDRFARPQMSVLAGPEDQNTTRRAYTITVVSVSFVVIWTSI
jgi:hypothetical protein